MCICQTEFSGNMKTLFFILFLALFFANTNVFAQQEKSNSSSASQTVNQTNVAEDKIYSKDEVDTQAVIKKLKVHPKLLKECISGGTIKVKIVLHKSGQVTDVTFLEKNSCANIDEEKIIAAIRKSKFSPAIKNGIPVSQFTIKILKFTAYE